MPITRSSYTSQLNVCLPLTHTEDTPGLCLRTWRKSGLLASWTLFIQVRIWLNTFYLSWLWDNSGGYNLTTCHGIVQPIVKRGQLKLPSPSGKRSVYYVCILIKSLNLFQCHLSDFKSYKVTNVNDASQMKKQQSFELQVFVNENSRYLIQCYLNFQVKPCQ